MFYLCLLIFGDSALVVLMALYAGVGIRESAEFQHIFCMIFPCVLVWLSSAKLLKLYPSASEVSKIPNLKDGNHQILWEEVFTQCYTLQRARRLIPVWLISTMFAIIWQTFYWTDILHSPFRVDLTRSLFLWYGSTNIVFLAFWRAVWTLCLALKKISHYERWIRIATRIVFFFFFMYQALTIGIVVNYSSRKFTIDALPENAPRTALVLGAGVYWNGNPSAALSDRVQTAVNLYKAGKVDTLLMSGDNSDFSRHETDTMAHLAEESGIPADAILRDNNGLHTRHSCDNAKRVFGLDEVVYVTNDFHIIRTLMTGDAYGLSGVAVVADRSRYNLFSKLSWVLRDWLSTPLWFLFLNR